MDEEGSNISLLQDIAGHERTNIIVCTQQNYFGHVTHHSGLERTGMEVAVLEGDLARDK